MFDEEKIWKVFATKLFRFNIFEMSFLLFPLGSIVRVQLQYMENQHKMLIFKLSNKKKVVIIFEEKRIHIFSCNKEVTILTHLQKVGWNTFSFPYLCFIDGDMKMHHWYTLGPLNKFFIL